MIAQRAEKRSSGPLFAFIDLLFLIVAFFTLLIFFTDTKRSEVEAELEETQQQLAAIVEERDVYQATMANLGPLMEQFMSQQRREAERRRELAARDLRRRQRPRVRVEYRITGDGRIAYQDRLYALEDFKAGVIDPLRETSWIAFHGFAQPETPFGTVVHSRRTLLQGQGEFDTYWDNLIRREPPASGAWRAGEWPPSAAPKCCVP